jgi:pantoate--beta-alanine ligase
MGDSVRSDPLVAARLDVVRTVEDLRAKVDYWRRRGETVGLVPTMGALHAGHLALVEQAVTDCARAVVSIFVNPTQFGPSEDLSRYPRQEMEDARKLADARASLIFAPAVEEMYPPGFATTVSVAGVTDGMEGAVRPGHFNGVATVVAKLLLQCLPDRVYFGEKDYQQLVSVKRMVRDLNIPTTVVPVPTVREADGLALSSRNVYLDEAQRSVAPALHRILRETAAAIRAGSPVGEAEAAGVAALAEAGFDAVDYLELRDAENLAKLDALGVRSGRLLAVARLGSTRLLDNIAVAVPG